MTDEKRCAAYTHKHPSLYVVLRSRTRVSGTVNVALALRGKSCGWGTCRRPRRWFVGHHRGSRPAFHRGVELVVCRDPDRDGMHGERQLFRVPLRSGVTTWRFGRRSTLVPTTNPEGRTQP